MRTWQQTDRSLAPCAGGRRSGVTLVETVVALSVFLVVLQAVAATLRLSDDLARRGRLETRASAVVQRAVEGALARPYDLLASRVEEGYLHEGVGRPDGGAAPDLYPYRLAVVVEDLGGVAARITVSLQWRPPGYGASAGADAGQALTGYEPVRQLSFIRRRES